MEEFKLERDSGAALSFKGECLAKAEPPRVLGRLFGLSNTGRI